MTKQIGSSLTVLMVSDLARSQQFYRDVMGFDVTDWWAERDGLTGLALKLLPAPDAASVRPNAPARGTDLGVDVYAYVENWSALDSLYREFTAKGARIARAPVVYEDDGPWKEFVVEDPDGYHLAFGGVDGVPGGSGGPADNESMRGGIPMKVDIVERPELKAAVLEIPRNGSRVREAWKEVAALLEGHPAVADREHGYVFIPEWQWATEVTTLWVGMAVHKFEGLPEGLQRVTIPAKRFAKTTVQGDRSHMTDIYGKLFEWFRDGPYERDVALGSLGYEANRLFPTNPFDIPADEIDAFDYDIYAPIVNDDAETGARNSYPQEQSSQA
ncbi:VOC family protein [Paenibacillus sp. TRM 82003]|nr:VOC family protein [Paenibacillus sp. TRM 82003]